MHEAEDHTIRCRGSRGRYEIGAMGFSCYQPVIKRQYFAKRLFWRKIKVLFLLMFFLVNSWVTAQPRVVDKKKFFMEGQLIEMTLVADFKKLIKEKLKKDYQRNFQPAQITCLFPDSAKVKAQVEIRPRGEYRREECFVPPIMVNFKTSNAGILKKLGRLKLVWPCGNTEYDEQLVLKEYLVYKIYNLITEKSFRVRLVKMSYQDISNGIKPRTAYSFFIENVDEMARRNNCIELQSVRLHTERTDRAQTTRLALFQYMIGNSDWAIPIIRNIKLIRSKSDSLAPPFAAPYDLDYSGLVNARYAVPPADLPISSVRERFYLGFPRTMEELQSAMQLFRNQRPAMDSLIMNLEPLDKYHKKEMKKYLDDFFEVTEKEKDIKELFISNARRE